MNWKHYIEGLSEYAKFVTPASEQTLVAAEAEFGMPLPRSLRELLGESDGVLEKYDLALIWPLVRIVSDNQAFRVNDTFRTLYMPFDGLLFFADAGNGDQFAFAVAGGEVRRPDVFVWNHEDDSRLWLASNLQDYLEGLLSGRLKL